jgi:hypothetical protein
MLGGLDELDFENFGEDLLSMYFLQVFTFYSKKVYPWGSVSHILYKMFGEVVTCWANMLITGPFELWP